MSLICNNCGGENNSEARYCRHCGIEFDHNEIVTNNTGDLSSSDAILNESISSEDASNESQEVSQGILSMNGDSSIKAADSEAEILEDGIVLDDRYRIIGLIKENLENYVYEAEDLLRCGRCNFEQTESGLTYCENCGSELLDKAKILVKMPHADKAINEQLIQDGKLDYSIIVPDTIQEKVKQEDEEPLKMIVGFQSNPGRIREINEDSLLVIRLDSTSESGYLAALGFYAIADGIGGHEAGEIASQLAVRSLSAGVMENLFIPEMRADSIDHNSLESKIKDIVQTANLSILSRRNIVNKEVDMGCTLTAAFIKNDSAIVANIGDSRTYLMRSGELSQITKDHSIVSNMMESGEIHSAETITHDQRGVIYRSLGEKEDLEIDIYSLELSKGDRLLLCCDGLWEMVHEQLLKEVMLERSNPQSACDRMVEMANLAGGDDNISVIIVNIE
jgi:serine/threonine protein phosphatase PrpC